MANVFYQTSIQLIFAVKNREAIIKPNFQESLHKYLGGILLNHRHKPLAINSVYDHIHIFFGMHPCDIPALIRELKSETSSFINQNKLSRFRFQWQGGYGLFTYSMSHRPAVIRYIENQQNHHRKRTFRDEYFKFLQKFKIEYDERYLFDFFE